jgi:hypothetical protein
VIWRRRFVIANLDRKMPWGPRAAGLAKALGDLEADVICLTESAEYEDTLVRDMPGAFFQVSDHINCPILVRADVFTRAKMGVSISVQGYGRKRYGTVVLLRDIETGLELVVAVWHPSNNGEYPSSSQANTGRIEQAKALIKILNKYADRGVPIVVLGDYNDLNWTSGIPGVMLGEGYRDMLKDSNMKVRRDRGFSRGLKAISGRWVTISKRLTDHGGAVVFDVGLDVPAEPELPPVDQPELPKPELTPMERLELKHKRIKVFKIASFEDARERGIESRYVGEVQLRLGQPVTTVWSKADEDALDNWRHTEFPTWPEEDYKGPVGPTSMKRLMEVGKALGLPSYEVVNK